MHLDHPLTVRLVSALGSPPAMLSPNGVIFTLSGAILLLGMLVCACFALLRQKIQHVAAQVSGRENGTVSLAAELEAQALLVRQMSIDLEELRKRVGNQHDTIQPAAPAWAGTDTAVNLNRRGQIIRLSRKGKSVAEIAHDLNVAQGEVELLLKVHDLSQRKSEPATP